jgi:hypothetical protein
VSIAPIMPSVSLEATPPIRDAGAFGGEPKSLASCAGVPSHLKPWKPLGLCLSCIRRTHIGTSVIQPAVVRQAVQWVCANRVAE